MASLIHIFVWVVAYGGLSLLLFVLFPRWTSMPTWVKKSLSPVVIAAIGIIARLLVWAALKYANPKEGAVNEIVAAIIIAADGCTLIWISSLAKERGLPGWLSLFHALGPMSILACAQGWPSVLLCFFIVGAAFFFGCRRAAWAGYLFLGAAFCCNAMTVFLVPLFVTRRNRVWLLLTLPLIVAYAIVLRFMPELSLGGPWALEGAWEQLHGLLVENRHAVDEWLLADLFRPLGVTATTVPAAAVLTLAVVATVSGLLIMKDDRVGAVAAVWMWMLVFVPGLDLTHLLILSAFLPLFPQRSWLLVFPLAAMRVLGGEETWWYESWVYIGFWLPLVLGLGHDCYWQAKPSGRVQTAPQSLDIVVPTLNEGKRLPIFLEKLQAAVAALKEVPTRIIVADGGSDDDTVAAARAGGAHVVADVSPGRGSQLAAGIEAGNSELVLMLHADAEIRPDALARLFAKLQRTPRVEWGILGHRYADRSVLVCLIELSNRARFHLGGIAFGDQGMFVRRDVLARAGGMPSLKLMEDIELSLRLTGQNCRLSLGDGLVASTRHWQKTSYGGYLKEVLRLSFTFLWRRLFGADPGPLTDRLYEQYYKSVEANKSR